MGMCQALLEQIDNYNQNVEKSSNLNIPLIEIRFGQLNVPFGIKSSNKKLLFKYNTNYFECGYNNLPDEYSLNNTAKLLDSMRKKLPNANKPLIIGLLSGGGSSLLSLPGENLSLLDKRKTIEKLVQKGANIFELNSVRGCLSEVKHGQLAVKCLEWNPSCEMITLIISDVCDDSLETIASAPTVLPSRFVQNSMMDAMEVLRKYSIRLEDHILNCIRKKMQMFAENRRFESTSFQNIIIGNNSLALRVAQTKAQTLGFKSILIENCFQGEAKLIVEKLLDMALSYVISPDDRLRYNGILWIAGGEATIRMDSCDRIGLGGRCQEMGLLFLRAMNRTSNRNKDRPMFALFAGTDGQDGPTPVAGVSVQWPIESKFQKKNHWSALERALLEHDSYNYWKQSAKENFLVTEMTGTNVMDIYLVSIPFD
ncbi:hypothetical protein SSS_05247 [Sarcoptes scabiei]|uniref:Glycerate kinase-like protein n=1 Tax=Sarcoptes scabiei TaxID=52283 RepID=A0A834VGN7_SARSC|nr:hypothetical protein SSS_05247 [Sarcoptes scabiei]